MSYRAFTWAEYVALGLDGPWTPPFALENRGPRDHGGSGKYYANRGTKILGICVHITAGITDLVAPDTSAEATTNYGRTTTRDASWTGIVDSDSIINSLHPDRVAWVQGVPGYNFNRPLMGLEIGLRNPDWNRLPEAWVAATLRNAAAYCAPFVIRYGIPLRVLTDRDEIQGLINAGRPVGFTEHWRLTPETRSDAGRVGNTTTFPWARFLSYVQAAIDQLTGPSYPAGWIQKVQAQLNDLGYTDRAGQALVEDDVYGPATEYATRDYQTDHDLEADGLPGIITATSLEDTMGKIDTVLDELKAVRAELKAVQAEQRRTPKTTAARVWATTLYGYHASWWIRAGSLGTRTDHPAYPADEGSLFDLVRRIAAKVLDPERQPIELEPIKGHPGTTPTPPPAD